MKLCWAQYFLWLVIAVAGSGAILAACGQSGDLYLPDKSTSEEKDKK